MSACSICASKGNGACCKRANIVVTIGDLVRISDYYLHSTSFWEYRLCHYRPDQNDLLWNVLFRSDNAARMLKVRDDGHCVMLKDATGCILPMDVRPLVCRLYPYDQFTEQGLEDFPDPENSDCPKEFSKHLEDNLADIIGVQRNDAVRWHKQLYDELRIEMKINGMSK